MIIGVTDPDKFTFSQQLIDHWESLGHTVKKSMYHEPRFVNECDAVFYDYASMMVGELAKGGKKPKKCVVRAIDVENYMNYHQRFDYDLIDHFIFLNPSQRKLLEEKEWTCPEDKVHIIPPGINLKKFTLQQKQPTDTLKIVYVGRLWIGKNVLGALDVAYLLHKQYKNVELHLRAEGLDPRWWKKQIEYRISQLEFPVHIDEHVEDMNQYLEDKHVMIVPSFKEAFSYVGAEALAKGIPVLFHDWYGSHDVWPEYLIYKTPDEALDVLTYVTENKTPEDLRKLVEDRYDEQLMFQKIDKLMGVA